MCIWEVEPEKRHCRYCSYVKGCEERKIYGKFVGISPRLDEYVSAMNGLAGMEVLSHTRKRPAVYGRYMLAFQLYVDGFSEKSIGDMLGLDRTTVIYSLKKMSDVIGSPLLYPDITELWIQFRTIIEKHKDEQNQ